ncbi:uncharacterized protein METZ01_LOCUS324211, partial [marine metagenome]
LASAAGAGHGVRCRFADSGIGVRPGAARGATAGAGLAAGFADAAVEAVGPVDLGAHHLHGRETDNRRRPPGRPGRQCPGGNGRPLRGAGVGPDPFLHVAHAGASLPAAALLRCAVLRLGREQLASGWCRVVGHAVRLAESGPGGERKRGDRRTV